MRTIKFRGKRVDNGAWVYGSLLQIGGGYIIYHGSTTECEIKANVGAAVELFPDECSVVFPETVGQYSGLEDWNGKDIYEGDLFKNKIGRISVCEYHHGGYWLRTIETLYCERLHDSKQVEICGNIHDNPELCQ